MKAFLEHVETGTESSIKVQTYERPMIDVPLHFHPEYELVYVQKGQGRLLLGDIEEEFTEGAFFFIPGSVPHLFTDDSVRTGKPRAAKVVVIQFKERLMEQLNGLPEFGTIAGFINEADAGYRIHVTPSLVSALKIMEKMTGIRRLNSLLEILNEIVFSQQYESLGTLSDKPMVNHVAFLKLRKLNGFFMANAHTNFSVEEAALLLNMNKSSFCRFLKRETGKTFTEHLTFHRINLACRLLRETDQTVTEVCYATGFNNPSYFFRRFREQKGVSPLEYRQLHSIV